MGRNSGEEGERFWNFLRASLTYNNYYYQSNDFLFMKTERERSFIRDFDFVLDGGKGVGKEGIYRLMFSTILVCHLLAFGTEMLCKRRVDDQLLANRVTGQLPRELILRARLGVIISCCTDIVCVFLDLLVVLLDCF